MSQPGMQSQGPDCQPKALANQRVACTGRLASMTRAEVVSLIRSCGGQPTSNISAQTSILIVGEEGWPLKTDGRLTRKLQAARRLRNSGSRIEILREGHFLQRIFGGSESPAVCDASSMLELTRLLGVSRDRLRAWLRAGLIRPNSDSDGLPNFDFREVSRAKTLVELAERGVSARNLRRSLQQLKRWMPGVEDSLDWLTRLQHDGKQLVLQSAAGERIEPSGQRRFDFDDIDDQSSVSFTAVTATEEDLFERAVSCEEDGDVAAACKGYRQLLEIEGPDPQICFNLGNALYAHREQAAALERFRQAVELDPSFCEAWLNLGNVLCEAGDRVEALRAFQRALAIDPDYADAHYSLADALEELGRNAEAMRHWRAYLAGEAYGEWADYARSRLASGA